MYKFTVTITNSSSSLDEFIFKSPQIVEISFDYSPSFEELITKLEPIVLKLKEGKNVALSIEIKKENGDVVFRGIATSDNKLHGTATL